MTSNIIWQLDTLPAVNQYKIKEKLKETKKKDKKEKI